MSQVVIDLSMSLDGFVTGPRPNLEHGLGIGGEVIHAWAMPMGRTAPDHDVLSQGFAATGAVVMGRRTFDFVDGPHGWHDDLGYGAEQDQSLAPPCFVVTHRPPTRVRQEHRFTFATDGVTAAVEAARAAAGTRDVVIMGGADVARQALDLGLVDQLRLHVAPALLGDGTPLFRRGSVGARLVHRRTVPAPEAVHVTYDVAY